MNRRQALGLPPGSVRALLAFLVIAPTMAMFVMNRAIPESLLALASIALMGYFNKQNPA